MRIIVYRGLVYGHPHMLWVQEMAVVNDEMANLRLELSKVGSPRFPFKGSFKGDVDIDVDIDVKLGCSLGTW